MMTGMEPYRFYASTGQGTALKGLFECLRENLLDETIVCTSAGMQLVAVNSSRNAMVSLQMLAQQFDVYHCTSKTLLGIFLANMVRLFKNCTSSDTVTLAILERDITNLHLTFQNTERVTKFSLRLLDLPERVIDLPARTFSTVISCAASDMQKLISNMSAIAETVEIKSTDDGIELQATGDFCTQTTTLLERDTSNHVIKQNGDESDSFGTYSLKALSVFCKASCISSTVDLHLKSDLLVLAYTVANLGRLAFLLGPTAEEM